MIVIRATKRLSQLIGVALQPADVTSPAILGDWYGNWLQTSIGPLVVLMNGPTRLTVLSQAREPRALAADLRRRLPRLLDLIGVPDEAIAQELVHFDAATFAKTVERTLLGSLNEICGITASQDAEGRLASPRGLDELEEFFTDFIHLKMPEKHPDDAVRARLGGIDPRVH